MLFLFQGCLGLSFKNWTGLSCGLTMDRMAGLQDLQDKLCWAKLGVKNGQDYGIAGLTSNLPLVKKIERKEKRVNRD
jgi:hypothetical protein